MVYLFSAPEYFHVNGEFSGGVKVNNNPSPNLSRNVPDQFHATDFVRPETKAMMNWFKAHSFVLSASILGGTL